MSSKKIKSNPIKLILLGAGGHAKVALEALANESKYQLLGYVDFKSQVGYFENYKWLGSDEVLLDWKLKNIKLINGLGSIGDTGHRRKIYEKFHSFGFDFQSLIHKSALVSKEVIVNEGVQIMAGSIIQPGTYIGVNTVVNTSASVDHDCFIGDHVYISPGATVCGGVRLGNGVHVGAGAVINQHVKIAGGSVIASGAVVLKDVKKACVMVGVPAKIKR